MALERPLGVVADEVAVADDAVRESDAVGLLLQPAGFRDRVVDADRGLDVDGLGDVLEAGLRDVLVGRVQEHLEGIDVAEDRVDPVRLEPGVAQLRILQVPVVDVGVDER